ncbi:DUF3870 domain-containing protein [Thermanaeromonas sp. C210]|uniref:DUF3870 domain-containing protein n=1 Tax=Thermanaeromonas sp. C210 TaxID=2731925 RepID=UPI00155D36B3|nr:DUF3870 domain-containing protein [Thermanaeromonas sp. C210]GFN22263.1 hypothetical protein TAMC210_05790 [Thermanaeromonas sp. C210]
MTTQEEETILITGYARLPSTITAYKLYEVVGVAVEVKPKDGEIVDVDCSLVPDITRKIIRKAVVGYKLSDGIDPLTERIERRYCGSAREAVVAAFRSIYEKWVAYRQGRCLEQREDRA